MAHPKFTIVSTSNFTKEDNDIEDGDKEEETDVDHKEEQTEVDEQGVQMNNRMNKIKKWMICGMNLMSEARKK